MIIAVTLVTLLVLFFVEFLARSAARGCFADLWLKEPLLQRKDDQMRTKAPRQPDVLFLGSSETMCAVDPRVLREHCGITAYNAGVFRGVMSYVSRWGRDFPLRRLRPRVVVIEVWPPILNDNADMVEHFHQYARAPYFTARRRIRFLYEAGHWLVFLRMLPLLSKPTRVVRLVVQTLRTRAWWTVHRPLSLPGVIGEGGESVEHDTRFTYRAGPRLQAVLHGLLADWQVGGREWQALTALVEHARATGARVLLYEPPYTEDVARDFFPGGEEAWERGWRRVRELATSLDAAWIEPDTRMTERKYFADPVHANLEGKTRFSIAIGDVLALELRAGASPAHRGVGR